MSCVLKITSYWRKIKPKTAPTQRYWRVKTSKGSMVHVLASDKEEAREEYYRSLESILGHQTKSCDCFPPEERQPFPREKMAYPVKIEKA